MEFLDYFSQQSAEYAAFRPTYPAELFEWVASLAPGRAVALDCATGNGQAAVGLAAHFDRVVAIDASETQLQHAVSHPRVEYRKGDGHETGLPAGNVDLVTVAQAFHWFQPERFYPEAQRVLKKRGALVLWAYNLPEITPAVDALVRDHYRNTLGAFWAPERNYVDAGYRTVEFPLNEIIPPQFAMESVMTREGLTGYISSWSATRRYISDRGSDPFESRLEELARCWGDEDRVRAHWPLYVRAGYFRD